MNDRVGRSPEMIDETGIVLTVIAVPFVAHREIKIAIRTEIERPTIVIGQAIEDGEQRFMVGDHRRHGGRIREGHLMKPLIERSTDLHAEIDEEGAIRREVRVKGEAEKPVLAIRSQGLPGGQKAGEIQVKRIGRACQIGHDPNLPAALADKKPVGFTRRESRAHRLVERQGIQRILDRVPGGTRRIGRKVERTVGLAGQLCFRARKENSGSHQKKKPTAEMTRHKRDVNGAW